MNKFDRSQAAHKRLWKKHDKSSSVKSRKLLNYHAECLNIQRKKGAVLSKKQRSTIFKDVMRWG